MRAIAWMAALVVVSAGIATGDDRPVDLRRPVAVGDGNLAGFASGGLTRGGQAHGAASLIARQAGARLTPRFVGGAGLPPPLFVMDADRDGRLDAGEVRRRRTLRLGWTDAGGSGRNLAVPGEDTASIFDAVSARRLAPALARAERLEMRDVLKPFLLDADRAAAPVSQLARAKALEPSFLLVWLGNSDALRLIPLGGPDRGAPSAEEFGQRFRRMLDVLADSGADMAVANVPDPSAFPVLRRAGGEVRSCREADGGTRRVGPKSLVSIAIDPALLPVPPCALVLTPEARLGVQAAVRAFNAEIAAAIDELEQRTGVRVARVDAYRLYEGLAARGMDLDGDAAPEVTTRWRGGLFGLDGIHPTRTGQAIIANAFIAAINDRFGTVIPAVDVTRTIAHDRLARRGRSAERPPLGLLAGGADAAVAAFPRRLATRLAARLGAGSSITAEVVGAPASYLMFSGLETGDNGEFDTTRNCEIVTSPVCTGRRACRKGTQDNPSTLLTRTMNVAEAYVRTYHRVAVSAMPSPTEACAPIVGFDTNGVVAVCSADVCVQTDGRLRYRLRDRVNGVTVGSPTASLDASTWRRVEVRSRLQAGVNDDECELRLDGVTIAAATNLNIGTGVLESAFATNRQGAYTQPPTPGDWIATYDDVAVTQGAWPGPGRVIARQGRAGLPTYDQFTPVGASIETAWSDTPPNTAFRAESPDTGNPLAQTMLVAPFDAGLHPVLGGSQLAACQTFLHAQSSAPPDRTYAIRRRVANTDIDTPLTGINAFAGLFGDGLAGGFWVDTLANVNASQIGAVKSGGAGGARMIVNDAWLACEYQPPAGEAACGGANTVDCVPSWGTAPVGAVPAFANYASGVSCTTGAQPAGYTPVSCSIAIGQTQVLGSSIRCAIYDNTPDPNRDFLCASAPTQAFANSLNTLPLTGCPTLAPNTPYWIVWNNNDNILQYRTADTGCNGPSGSMRYVAATYPTGQWTPDPWGATLPDTCRLTSFLTLAPITGSTTSSTSTTSTTSTSTSVTSTSSTTSTSRTTTTIPTTTSSSVTSTTSSSTTSTTASGLVAAYGFSENQGSSVTDRSGNGNNGTIANATWTPDGRFGSALLFNGTNAWVTVLDANSLDVTRLTLEAWVFPTVAPNNWRTIVCKETTNGLPYFLHASGTANRPATGVTITNLERLLSGTAQIPTNAWTHLAATYDGAVQRLYVNGTQVATRNQTGNIDVSTGVLRIGGNGPFGEFFQGRIDEVRVYNRALTAGEITTDMNQGVGP